MTTAVNTSLALGKLTSTQRSIYTVPNNVRTNINFIEFVNNDSGDRVLTLSIKKNQVLHTKSITLSPDFSLAGKYNLMLNSGDSLDAFSDKGDVIDFFIGGSEETIK